LEGESPREIAGFRHLEGGFAGGDLGNQRGESTLLLASEVTTEVADRDICAGWKVDGQPCQSPFIVAGSRFCSAHQPDGGREEMQRRGRLGALIQQRSRSGGLDEDELPALETHDDAKEWLGLIARAVCGGRLRESAAQAAIRAIECWLKAEGERLTVHVVEDLRREVDRLKVELGQRNPMKAWG